MNRQEISRRVGLERYETARTLAREDSARPDYGARDISTALEMPHEIEAFIWDTPMSFSERIALFFSVYDDMPAYGHLLYAKLNYGSFSPQDRTRWWSEVRKQLAGHDIAVRQPLQYALWCSFFEDENVVEEAWTALTGRDIEPEVLRAVLPMAGPVPYPVKAALYMRLIPDETWHGAIFDSLLQSGSDVYGELDKEHARGILLQLRLPTETQHVEDFRAKLA